MRTQFLTTSNWYWVRTLKTQIIKFVERGYSRTRFTLKEKRLNYTFIDGLTKLQQLIFSFETSLVLLFSRLSSEYSMFYDVLIPFLNAFFHVIYCPLHIIFTTHVLVGFRGSLSVPSNTFWNLILAAVRLLHHCSGITSTLMRPESWLRGN